MHFKDAGVVASILLNCVYVYALFSISHPGLDTAFAYHPSSVGYAN